LLPVVGLWATAGGADLTPTLHRALRGGIGAAGGAAVGAIVGDNPAIGAAVGGAVGTVVGALWQEIHRALK
jgi:osmotically inducible lipoprotein OsmB